MTNKGEWKDLPVVRRLAASSALIREKMDDGTMTQFDGQTLVILMLADLAEGVAILLQEKP